MDTLEHGGKRGGLQETNMNIQEGPSVESDEDT